VRLINTMSNEVLDEAGVRAKFGVPPERIVDYLTLVGDTVDNVPGVDKVGPKTAVKWLNEFGSLDDLLARAGEVKGAVGENLRRALDWLPMGRRLITVKTDVALDVHPNDLGWKPEDQDVLRELFAKYNFRTWLREVSLPSRAGGAAGGREGEFAEHAPRPPVPRSPGRAPQEREQRLIKLLHVNKPSSLSPALPRRGRGQQRAITSPSSTQPPWTAGWTSSPTPTSSAWTPKPPAWTPCGLSW
jgi:hypothetical protein